eukprot:TRINITY_DN59682_c0_g1_i1.p1 TRINITY_DN59682_c0_g1~~TRINITY_DN59682_c0_g1_i1.p1  ORF type:complete len:680 (+),score=96.88 TRINITY_DN59682_c0_g1_i1:100-2040(+)
MGQAVHSYIVIGFALATYGVRELVLDSEDPRRFDADGLEHIIFVGLAICTVSLLTVKLWKNARLQEVVAISTMLMTFTVTMCLSSFLLDDITRNQLTVTWRVFALFPPLVLRWRLGASLAYALCNTAKDLALHVHELAMYPGVTSTTVSSICFLNVAVCMCYIGLSADTRRHYCAETHLAEEKESMRSLLRMQCEAIVSLDTHRCMTGPGLNSILGDEAMGKSIFDFLADGEDERVCNALDTVKSTKQVTLLPTTFLANGNELPVEIFFVHCSGKDSFLIGVHISREVLRAPADREVAGTIQQDFYPAEPCTVQEMESEVGFPAASDRGTEHVFEVTALRNISEIVEIGSREHWLIEKDALDFTQSSAIGEGGFGQVVTAKFRGADVAVKLRRIRANTDKLKKQVLLELRMLRHLHHPNIVEFFGATVEVSDANWSISLVFELIDGGITCTDLVEMVHEQGLDEEHRDLLLHILEDTCNALSYMHGLKPPVVHRDVKGSNILCTLCSGLVRAKLCDFGLSHHTGKEKSGGTPNMMAPEALLEQPVTTAVDVFAFGRLVFMIVTGIKPLRGMKMASLIQLASEGRVPCLDWELVSNCNWPEEVMSACQQLSQACMEFQVEKRPSIYYVTQQVSLLRQRNCHPVRLEL